jgi:glycogen(starch) synthase
VSVTERLGKVSATEGGNGKRPEAPGTSPAVSVVINTYNRARSLQSVLAALPRQNYSPFEVIVVNGPSDDGTGEVLERHRDWIRVGTCQDKNLSVSRNVGIAMAQGEIVAFLDDDAVPDENWLTQLVPVFEAPDVGGACGLIFDHTGYRLQYRHVVCNRLSFADTRRTTAPPDLCFPGTMTFPHVMGVGAFRRSVLQEVGGFDEEYEYFLDETDLCLRIIEAGYRLSQVAGGYVYHYSRASHLRDENRMIVDWFPIIKNTVYYCAKHALGQGDSFKSIMEAIAGRVTEARGSLERNIRSNGVDPAALDAFSLAVKEGWEVGLTRGLNRAPRLMGSRIAQDLRAPTALDALGSLPGKFRPVKCILPAAEKLVVCLLSQAYPPAGYGGIATYTAALAQALAEAGHIVHVLTRSPHDHSTVEFENGVWVHRVIEQDYSRDMPEQLRAAPQIWNYSRSMLDEVRRLSQSHPVDIVEAPIWDSEGIAFVMDGAYPVITTLQTPFRVAYETNPDWTANDDATRKSYKALVLAEEYVLRHSSAIWAISHAVLETIRDRYGIDCSEGPHVVIPLGLEDAPPAATDSGNRPGDTVLYVGRIESRKGTDVLLEAIPALCRRHPEARFCFAGEEVNRDIKAAFLRRHAGAAFLDRVEFLGWVSADRLESLYASCTVLVAPSRYESFGLVYLEAMRRGKPVVGCRVGGVVEVVDDGVSGLLVEPDNPKELETALDALLGDPDRRRRMGEAAKRAFLDRFTRTRMADASVRYYRQLLQMRNPGLVAQFTPWTFCVPRSGHELGRLRIPLDRGGHLVYGPYREIPRGDYSALFECSAQVPNTDLAGFALEFDAAVCWGRRTFSLARTVIDAFRPGEDRRLAVTLHFHQPEEETQAEFRIRSRRPLPGGALTFSSVTLLRRDAIP